MLALSLRTKRVPDGFNRTLLPRGWRELQTAPHMIAATFLILAGLYLLCGLVFAIPFALAGAGKIDPHASHGSWGFRLLIIPGTMAFWPLLLRRWLGGAHEPPEECNAHRLSAECRMQNAKCPRTEDGSRSGRSTLHSALFTLHCL